jgi:hypothetical protein
MMSMPAIVIDRPHHDEDGAGAPLAGANFGAGAAGSGFGPAGATEYEQPVSMPEIIVDMSESGVHTPPPVSDDDHDHFSAVPAVNRTPVHDEIIAPEQSDSQQFVLPERAAIPAPHAGQSMISRAVEVAVPSSAAAAGVKVSGGSAPPVPLSQLATDSLVRPEEGAELFEVTATGALVIRVVERTVTRLDGIHISGGELEYEPATRRSRGSQTDERFDYGGSRFHMVSGNGYLIAVPGDKKFTAVTLDDDIFYLREDLVFAFDATLRWENGNVPGLRGKLPVVQFRGDGAVALRTSQQLLRVKLPAQGILYVDATRLAGWIGRVIPRAVVPPEHGPLGEMCVECTGEGVVLVDPTGMLPPVVTTKDRDERAESPRTVPPPPPPGVTNTEASGPIELDVVKNADWLSEGDDETKADDAKQSDEI